MWGLGHFSYCTLASVQPEFHHFLKDYYLQTAVVSEFKI